MSNFLIYVTVEEIIEKIEDYIVNLEKLKIKSIEVSDSSKLNYLDLISKIRFIIINF